jgi:hypothetical protein
MLGGALQSADSSRGISIAPWQQYYDSVDTVATDGFIAQHRSPATKLNPGLILARRANVQGISVGSTRMFEAVNRVIA